MKRIRLVRWIFVVSGICVLFFGVVESGRFSRVTAQEREYAVGAYKDLPVAIQEVKNLQAEEDRWFRDLQVVVKNVSDKPIYFISMHVVFPEMTSPGGNSRIGFNLLYGRRELGDIKVLAEANDVPIKPGDTYIFTIPSFRADGYESMKKRRGMGFTKLQFMFGAISFGDRTGFNDGLSGLLDFRAKAANPNSPL
jgi:hypothetical protein